MTAEGNELSYALFPPGGPLGKVVVLRAFLDESYDQKGDVFTVAGFISTPLKWDAFTREWRRNLRRFGVRVFHMEALQNREGEFKTGWSGEEKRIDFLQKLTAIIERRIVTGVGCSVLVPDFKDVFVSQLKDSAHNRPLREPYVFCLRACLEQLLIKTANWKGNQAVCFCDWRDGKDKARKLAREHCDNLRERYPAWRARLLGPEFVHKETYLPLQAADLFAYEMFKHIDRQKVPGRPPLKVRGLFRHLQGLQRIWGPFANREVLEKTVARLRASGEIEFN